MSLALIEAILSIVIIDLVLSGDNAVVIGMAARRLSEEQRRRAILFGALGAIGLRITFTAMVALLLSVPLLQAIGGVVLVWIAFKLLRQEHEEQSVREGVGLFDAVRTIIIADVVMSLDNILAVGGAAHGDLKLLLFGLALSMPIIMFGSNLVAVLMNRIPWLVYLGSAVLAYTAGEMILEDRIVGGFLPHNAAFEWIAIGLLVIGTIGLAHWFNLRQRPYPRSLPPHDQAESESARAEPEAAGVASHHRSSSQH